MQVIERGCYRARPLSTPSEITQALGFRSRCFGLEPGQDQDHLDDVCTHMVIEKHTDSATVCYFRLNLLSADQVHSSYAAQFYHLGALEQRQQTFLEMGRFCVDPARSDPDILRLAWAAVTKMVDQHNVKMLFGCTSFQGNEPLQYQDAFSLLKARHLAPCHSAPVAKAANTYDFAYAVATFKSRSRALQQMPPLLRSYLSMGAWVSDHAVIDPVLNTLHVFTGLEIDAIPAPRKRLLRAI